MPAAATSSSREFVTFTLKGQRFCLEIMQIREIRRWVPVTRLPHSAPDVLGVMNLRGMVIPIFDLAARFGMGKSEPDPRSVVIIVNVDGGTVGLMVESVSEIMTADDESVRSTPGAQFGATLNCIQGLIPINGTMTQIINLPSVVQPRFEALT